MEADVKAMLEETVSKRIMENYLKVQKQGIYNMFDQRARVLVGATKHEYNTIFNHYSNLIELYGLER